MILADSCALPRTFPENEITHLEETYPFLLQENFDDVTFFKLCMGGVTGPDLVGQAISYMGGWAPDVIIVQVGIDDCRPEPLPNFFRILISEIPIFRRLKVYIYHPVVMSRLLKYFSSYRVPPKRFKRNIQKLKVIFPESQILWLEIFTSENGGYEEQRPGVLTRISEFNTIIKKVLNVGFVEIQKELNIVNGINADHLHLNSKGHKKTYEILKAKINEISKNI